MNPLPSDKSANPAPRRNNAQRHTRRWLPYTGALMLGAIILAGLWPEPAPVETARAVVGRLRATVNEEGKTRIKQRYVIAAPVTGQLRRIPFKAGAEVQSPVTGRVLRVFEESSRVVAAGTPLLEVGDPTELEVVIEALSRDGAVITPGMQVDLEQWGGGEPLKGRVRHVEPAAFTKISALGVEEQRVYVVADLLTPREERPGVGDNFRVEARVVVWQADQALKVPAGALFRRGPDWAVFVVAGGRARLRPVKAGRSSGAETQIVDGLKEGEAVILYPGERVKDGQRVRQIQI